MRDVRFLAVWLLALGALVLLSRCDTVVPERPGVLVVEGFLDAEKPLPAIVLRRTAGLDGVYPGAAAVEDAEVEVRLDGERIAYRPAGDVPGRYVPVDEGRIAPARSRFDVSVLWEAQAAQASGTIPPPVVLDSVVFEAPADPVPAVLLDSLRLTDSLGVGARQGFVYPVEVTLWWTVDFEETAADSAYWVRTQLQPQATPTPGGVFEFFVRPEQVLRERSVARGRRGQRSWTGVYAVQVETEDEPLPRHRLKAALLRSGADYARFATSRTAPAQREPISNVTGALGIVAGISVDSLTITVR